MFLKMGELYNSCHTNCPLRSHHWPAVLHVNERCIMQGNVCQTLFAYSFLLLLLLFHMKHRHSISTNKHSLYVCMCVSFPVWAVGCSANKQGGLKYREVVERKRGKKVRREWFFSPLFPWVLQRGFSLELPHFISCCAYLCVCLCVVCMCELCEGLAPPWWFIVVGSGPICFRSVSCSILASLQHSPGPPDA